MTIIISGPGVGLPFPTNLYPSELGNAPADLGSNFQNLSGGATLPIPAGRWLVDPGSVSVIQFLDPVTGIWRMFDAQRGQPQQIVSDGFTRRVANLTGCAVSAVVAGGGSGFTQSTATITANVGGSTWQAIVGGSLSVSTVNVAGANYNVAPLVMIQAPQSPGIQATAYATLSSGTVSSVSLNNFGAGYTSGTAKAVIVPSPTDVNVGTITQATVTLIVNAANSGAICGALCTNPGNPLATISALTLTAAGGAGTGATITPVVMQTVTSASIVAGGTGFTGGGNLFTTGGIPASVSAIVNPAVELTNYRPRTAQGFAAATSGTLTGTPTIYDGGLFVGTPYVSVVPLAGVLQTASASVTVIASTAQDVVMLQQV